MDGILFVLMDGMENCIFSRDKDKNGKTLQYISFVLNIFELPWVVMVVMEGRGEEECIIGLKGGGGM